MEIMVVLLIIGILATFVMANITAVREKSEAKGCIVNMEMIDAAKGQWALEYSKISGASVEWSDIYPAYLAEQPECPSTKTSDAYTLNVIGSVPTCVVGSNDPALDWDDHIVD